jgi:hypothetical protein
LPKGLDNWGAWPAKLRIMLVLLKIHQWETVLAKYPSQKA